MGLLLTNLVQLLLYEHRSGGGGGVRPSVAKMTIFIVTQGPGCVGSELADEAYPGSESSGAVGA